MKNLFIPPLGTVVVLAEDWAFKLFYEYRNEVFLRKLGYDLTGKLYCSEPGSEKVILPKGSKLRLDRIYIRKGVGDYDSVTFFLVGENHPMPCSMYKKIDNASEKKYVDTIRKTPIRFWAKLSDVNKIKMED